MKTSLTILLMITYLILLILIRTYSSSVHEYIHYFFANRYSPCKALIVSQFNLYKKNPNIRWVKHNLLTGGITYIDNDFLSYNEHQIRVIAIMPKIATIIAYNVVNIGFMVGFYSLYKDNENVIKYIVYFLAVYVLWSIYEFFRGKSAWCDRDIFFNPKGFKEYMRNQHENSLADSYQYNMIKRNK